MTVVQPSPPEDIAGRATRAPGSGDGAQAGAPLRRRSDARPLLSHEFEPRPGPRWSLQQAAPWLFSLTFHSVLVAFTLLVAGTAALLRQEAEAPVIVADFDALAYNPVARSPGAKGESDAAPVLATQPIETPAPSLDTLLSTGEGDPMKVIGGSGEPAGGTLAPFGTQASGASARFVGLSSSNARRVVYLIDASGSMIPHLPFILDELTRSLNNLTPQQSFAIIFFQRNEAVMVPPAGKLIPASAAEKTRALQWIREKIIPSGRSNPMAAVDVALALKPDVVFVLSQGITGSGEFEIDQKDLMKKLDERNPRDPETGRRKVTINCIQFLDPDPLNTLQVIAREHGGPKGYRFLSRVDLGLEAP